MNITLTCGYCGCGLPHPTELGMSAEDYELMISAQGGEYCPVCHDILEVSNEDSNNVQQLEV